MGTTLKIAQVARRSGFTPATLRYYDDIGLLAPIARSDAGYRLYDETSLERLRFIARAKQLGIGLDEITELTVAWDGGRCAPVQDRLRTAVEAKIADAYTQIAQLTTLVADLQRAAAALSAVPSDGPCDDTCGCLTDTASPASPAVPVPLVRDRDDEAVDRASTDVPIACTLPAGDMSARLDDWNQLLAGKQDLLQGVTARRALDDGGVRLEFGPGSDVAEIARLAAAEQSCCRFFSFSLVIDTRGIALEVHAPPAGRPVLTALFGVPA